MHAVTEFRIEHVLGSESGVRMILAQRSATAATASVARARR